MGGFEQLRRMREQIRGLGDGTLIRKAREVLGATALHEVDQGFAEKRAPNGAPWAPSNGFGTVMEDKHLLRNSFSSQPIADGFVVANNAASAAQRNYGGIIVAKNKPYLRFKVPFSVRIAISNAAGWRRHKFGLAGYQSNWIQVKSVKQPARPMVPEGALGPIWEPAFTSASNKLLAEHLGRPNAR